MQRTRDLIVQIEHQTVALLLAAVDCGFRLHIFVKILVIVRWLGVRLVIAATCGECFMPIS